MVVLMRAVAAALGEHVHRSTARDELHEDNGEKYDEDSAAHGQRKERRMLEP
jgi:hypothetical protein